VLFHNYKRFVDENKSQFERVYGFFCPVVNEVVERYLDCGNLKYGFARIILKCALLKAYLEVIFPLICILENIG
jgi:hypothetical protein